MHAEPVEAVAEPVEAVAEPVEASFFNISISPLIKASFLALDQPCSCLSLLKAWSIVWYFSIYTSFTGKWVLVNLPPSPAWCSFKRRSISVVLPT